MRSRGSMSFDKLLSPPQPLAAGRVVRACVMNRVLKETVLMVLDAVSLFLLSIHHQTPSHPLTHRSARGCKPNHGLQVNVLGISSPNTFLDVGSLARSITIPTSTHLTHPL
jgi:hypothetical protein